MAVDRLMRKASGGGQPVVTGLSTTKTNGATTASLNATTDWNTGAEVDVVIYINDGGEATWQTTWVANLSGTSLSDMVLRSGTEPPAGYPATADTIVMCAPTAAWADDLITALAVEHSADTGIHDATVIAKLAGAQTFTGNKTFSGQVNINGKDITAAYDAVTPTYSNFTLGNGSVGARWKQIGKLAHYYGTITLGTTSSMSTNPRISLPVAAKTGTYVQNLSVLGMGGLKSATADVAAPCYFYDANEFGIFYYGNNGGNVTVLNAITSSAPFSPWNVATNKLSWDVRYEVA